MTLKRLAIGALAMGVALSVATARADDEKGKGGIKGVAKYDGPPPPAVNIPVSQDDVCKKAHPKGSIAAQANMVFGDGTLPYVFVYVKSGLKGKYSAPAEPAVIDQKGCTYTPHVLGMQAGQKLRIKNSDPTTHNIHPKPKKNTEFNISQPKPTETIRDDFKKPEVMIEVKCDVHPWMSAFIGVVEHPFYAVSGKGGAFDIKDLPDGDYEVEAWHEKWGNMTQKVTIKSGETKEIEFKFSKKAAAAGGGNAPRVVKVGDADADAKGKKAVTPKKVDAAPGTPAQAVD